jgi:hypothetical protein
MPAGEKKKITRASRKFMRAKKYGVLVDQIFFFALDHGVHVDRHVRGLKKIKSILPVPSLLPPSS